jgi:hypothetical protein
MNGYNEWLANAVARETWRTWLDLERLGILDEFIALGIPPDDPALEAFVECAATERVYRLGS